MLPNFLIIGSQKAGTTSLYHVLKQHPEIYMSERKEINFFSQNDLFNKGIEYYENFFQDAPSEKRLRGEASPGYLCSPETPARIKKYMPNAKLILTVRNPISRAYSQYWDNRRRLFESLTFGEAIDQYLDDSYTQGKVGYFNRGVYMKYIRSYLEYFAPEQILIMIFEDLLENPSEFYKTIFEFLNVDPDFRMDDISKAYNSFFVWGNPFYGFFFSNPHYQTYLPKKLRRLLYWGKRVEFKYPNMSVKERRQLNDFYEPWNIELSEYLGRDLSMWR